MIFDFVESGDFTFRRVIEKIQSDLPTVRIERKRSRLFFILDTQGNLLGSLFRYYFCGMRFKVIPTIYASSDQGQNELKSVVNFVEELQGE